MPGFPPQDLVCPDPVRCPVTADLPELSTTTVIKGRRLFRVYKGTWGYDEYNPGFGDARFSPFDDPLTGDRVPAMYLADDRESALLETVFHDVAPSSSRTVYEKDLVGMLLAHVRVPSDAVVGDLRNTELDRLNLDRDQVVSSSAEHYPCTRRLALQAVARTDHQPALQGLIWHSRQDELAGRPDAEVLVLFGHRYPTNRGSWELAAPGIQNLFDGPGRLLAEDIADQLDAVIEHT